MTGGTFLELIGIGIDGECLKVYGDENKSNFYILRICEGRRVVYRDSELSILEKEANRFVSFYIDGGKPILEDGRDLIDDVTKERMRD